MIVELRELGLPRTKVPGYPRVEFCFSTFGVTSVQSETLSVSQQAQIQYRLLPVGISLW